MIKLKDLIHMDVIISQNKNRRDKKTFFRKIFILSIT